MNWTADRIERAKTLWAQDYSAAAIAVMLGGVTRNAVLGLLHRHKVPPRSRGRLATAPATCRAAPPAQRPHQPRKPAVKAASAPDVVLPSPPPAALRVSLLDLSASMCHFPLGDPGQPDFGYCGGPASIERPYCVHHWRIMHDPARKAAPRGRFA